MTDQTQSSADTSAESLPSGEILALLGEDQTVDSTGQEEVTPETETGKTDTDTSDEATHSEGQSEKSEENLDETSDTADETSDETNDETDDTKKESQEYLVAGVKYTDFNDAVLAVNRISGANTQLAGKVNSLEQDLSQRDDEISTLRAKVKEWEEYYDSDGEAKKPTEVDINEQVRKAIEAEKQREQTEQLKSQYRSELSALEQEPDYTVVIPHMQSLAQKLGDSLQKISPKELYQMARGMVQGDKPKDVLKTAQELADQKLKKEASQEKAKKVIGGNARKSPSIVQNDDVSPEVAAILN